MMQFNAVIKNDGAWWIGWIEELPGVNCQARTESEPMEDLRSALAEAIELNRQDVIR